MNATEPRLYDVPPIEGNDDYLDEGGLAAVARLIDRIPDSWDVTSTQAHNGSVTVTVKQVGPYGPMAQAQAFDDLLSAGAAIRTLHANLVACRAALAALANEPAEAKGPTSESEDRQALDHICEFLCRIGGWDEIDGDGDEGSIIVDHIGRILDPPWAESAEGASTCEQINGVTP